MNDLSGYKVRDLIFKQDHPKSQWAFLANDDIVSITNYDGGSWGVVKQPFKGGDEHYAVASKEDAIIMCNGWNREIVMQLLEKV